jgi:hypothetical protein
MLARAASASPFEAMRYARRAGLRELALDHGKDEFVNLIAQASFDRTKSIVEKVHSRLTLRLRRLRLRSNIRHGVVSSPALQRQKLKLQEDRQLSKLPALRGHRKIAVAQKLIATRNKLTNLLSA